MVDALERPFVSPQRYRELEIIAYQVMLLVPNHDLGECLIVRDICTNILRRWVEDERMATHEIAARTGTPLMATPDGKIIHLRPAE